MQTDKRSGHAADPRLLPGHRQFCSCLQRRNIILKFSENLNIQLAMLAGQLLNPNEEFLKSEQHLVIDDFTSGDCDDDSEGGEGDGDGEEAHDALKARLLYEGQVDFCLNNYLFNSLRTVQ